MGRHNAFSILQDDFADDVRFSFEGRLLEHLAIGRGDSNPSQFPSRWGWASLVNVARVNRRQGKRSAYFGESFHPFRSKVATYRSEATLVFVRM